METRPTVDLGCGPGRAVSSGPERERERARTGEAVGTFEVLQDVAVPEGQRLLELLVQHAVHGDEALIQRHHVREADGGADHALRPVHRGALRDPVRRRKHPYRGGRDI